MIVSGGGQAGGGVDFPKMVKSLDRIAVGDEFAKALYVSPPVEAAQPFVRQRSAPSQFRFKLRRVELFERIFHYASSGAGIMPSAIM